MSRLVWGEPGKRFYETGIDRGVLYPREGVGVPWNGLIAVSEAPSGADLLELYYDGDKAIAQRQRESFAGKIAAYSFPKEFELYDGFNAGMNQQGRPMFNFSYRTKVANDTGENEHYKIHLVYNMVTSPAPRSYSSVNTDTDAITMIWDFATLPEILPTGEVSAHLIIDPTVAYPWVVSALEDLLYGTALSEPRMPSMIETVAMFENASILKITDNGDGTWTADGPEDAIEMLSGIEFEITWPSALYIDSTLYRISSL